MRRLLIRLSNALTRRRRVRVPARNLLLLVPHCLQNSGCQQNVSRDLDRCRRCGQCDMAALLALRDRYGLLCHMAGGGREALHYVEQPEVRAVVAVACEKELVDGIRASFPKPVLAVANQRPHGPCRDTRVDVAAVEAAVRELLGE